MLYSLVERISKMFSNAHSFLLWERQMLEEEWSESFAIEPTQTKPDGTPCKGSKCEVAHECATEQTLLFKRPSHASASSRIDDSTSLNKECSNSFDFLKHSKLRILLLSYWVYTFMSVAQSEAFPLVAMSHNGGLGLNETVIGTIATISGLVYCMGQYITFTSFLRRFGVVRTMRYGALGACLSLGLMPFGLYMTGSVQALYLAIIMGIILIVGNVFLGSSTMATNQIVDPQQRARMNGVSGLGTSIARGAGPIFAGRGDVVCRCPLGTTCMDHLLYSILFRVVRILDIPTNVEQDYKRTYQLMRF
jgi:hypothetical protein